MRSPPDSWVTCSTASPAKPASPSATPAQTGGYSSQGLRGSFTVQQGLARLLADTPLEAEDQGDGSFVLREAPAKDGDVLNMQAVEVFALGNNLGSTDGYLATHSQIATKTSKPLLETSQTVSVITREQIDDTASKTVQQAMRYTPASSPARSAPPTATTTW